MEAAKCREHPPGFCCHEEPALLDRSLSAANLNSEALGGATGT